jgi:hypothetical protein
LRALLPASTLGIVARGEAGASTQEKTVAGPCNGYCPVEDLGFDPKLQQYWYRAYDCNSIMVPKPIVTVATNRAHQVGGDCTDCTDCIQGFFARFSSGQALPTVANGKYLRDGVFRKGVPNPRNAFARCDEFSPGPTAAVLAEYTAAYRLRRWHLVRLFTVGSSSKPVHVLALGWELDPTSPPSPFFVPHLSSLWIRNVKPVAGGHIVDVDQIGVFLVATVRWR